MKDLEQPLEISPFPIDYCFCDIYLEDSFFWFGDEKKKWILKQNLLSLWHSKNLWKFIMSVFLPPFQFKGLIILFEFLCILTVENLSDFFMTLDPIYLIFIIKFYCRFVDDFVYFLSLEFVLYFCSFLTVSLFSHKFQQIFFQINQK